MLHWAYRLLSRSSWATSPRRFARSVAGAVATVTVLGLLAVPSLADHPQESSSPSILQSLQIESVSVWPQQLTLHNVTQTAQVLVTGHLADGQQVDLTRAVDPPAQTQYVRIAPGGQVAPVAPGEEIVTLRYGPHEVALTVTVNELESAPQLSFVQDVAPSLSKMGCNSGTCHGSKDGQNGFKLSLRGYDFAYDHRALTDDIGARRFNRANPDQSLILLKATGSIPHVGGVLTSPGERRYDLIRAWIAGGAQLDLDADRVTGIEILPDVRSCRAPV